jgi:hypothetical protein
MRLERGENNETIDGTFDDGSDSRSGSRSGCCPQTHCYLDSTGQPTIKAHGWGGLRCNKIRSLVNG